MNRKQLFTLIGVLALACLCVAALSFAGLAYVGNKTISNLDNPANAQKIASSIVDYTVPSGYKQIAMDMVVSKYVVLIPDPEGSSGSGPMIMLMAYPPNSNLNEKQMQEELERVFARQSGQNVDMHVVETKTVLIRGKSEKVSVLEGTDRNGYQMRQWFTVFAGKNGLVMLMIQDNKGKWKEQLVNDFIASIK